MLAGFLCKKGDKYFPPVIAAPMYVERAIDLLCDFTPCNWTKIISS